MQADALSVLLRAWSYAWLAIDINDVEYHFEVTASTMASSISMLHTGAHDDATTVLENYYTAAQDLRPIVGIR
jgi:hypothetical protein